MPMNPSIPPVPPATAGADKMPGEPMLSVVWRRTRYVAAILACGVLFYYAAWALVAPPPALTGASLLLWTPLPGWLSAGLLTLMLLAAMVLAMLLVHPDDPHTGLYCALLGMAILTVRGGTMFMVLEHGQLTAAGAGGLTLPTIYHRLAWECLAWGLMLAAAEVFGLLVWRRFFANRVWMLRSGVSEDAALRHGNAPGMAWRNEPGRKQTLARRVLADLGGFAITLGLATVLLAALMQSQAKGQVLFACFAAFGLAAAAATFAMDDLDPGVLWLAVPATAAIGYLMAQGELPYPGHAVTALTRALPMDYMVAGVPGAIVGYYSVIRSRMHHVAMEEAEMAGG